MDNTSQQLLIVAKKLRAELEAIKLALLSLRDDLHGQMEEINKSNKANDKKQQMPHETITEAHLPEGVEIHKSAPDARQDKKYQRHSLVLQWLTFIALVLYAYFTYMIMKSTKDAAEATSRAANAASKSAKASEDTAKLTKHEVVGTDAAILEGYVRYSPSQDTPPGLPVFSIDIANTGKSMATQVKGTITVSRKTLPGLKTISSHTVSIDIPQIVNDSGPNRPSMGIGKAFQVPGFNLDAVMKLRETVRVEGTYTYDNGFGDIIKKSLCYQLKANLNAQACAYQGAFFIGCDDIPYETSRMDYMERQCKQQQTDNQKH
jgi:uncharacterized protein (UPF0333 family)